MSAVNVSMQLHPNTNCLATDGFMRVAQAMAKTKKVLLRECWGEVMYCENAYYFFCVYGSTTLIKRDNLDSCETRILDDVELPTTKVLQRIPVMRSM